jgi:hypothetical protein
MGGQSLRLAYLVQCDEIHQPSERCSKMEVHPRREKGE